MNLANGVDESLEALVVPSFSRIGYAVRRRLFRWDQYSSGAMTGRTVLVTGPTSGLGRAVTDGLAALGARVVLLGRSRERLAAVRDELVENYGEDRFPTVVADLASLASVRAAVDYVLATEPQLDVPRSPTSRAFSRTPSPRPSNGSFRRSSSRSRCSGRTRSGSTRASRRKPVAGQPQ